MESFWSSMGVFFTIIGIISMLIIAIKLENFIIKKLLEFGNALADLEKHDGNGQIITLGDDVTIVYSEKDIPTSLTYSPTVSKGTTFKHKIN